MEYMVVVVRDRTIDGQGADALTAKVTTALGQNWRPCGGVVVTVDAYTGAIMFYQAMVREGGPPM